MQLLMRCEDQTLYPLTFFDPVNPARDMFPLSLRGKS